jgi:hypothetical protein
LTVLACLVTVAAAAYDPYSTEPPPRDDIEDLPEWREGAYRVPPYPQESNLVEFAVPGVAPRYRFFLDQSALSLGGDGVVRYLAVLDPGTGSRNLLFEGILCRDRTYKTYAVGAGDDGPLREVGKSDWQRIPDRGPMRFRDELARFFFCNGYGQAFSLDDIADKVRASGQERFHNDDYNFEL